MDQSFNPDKFEQQRLIDQIEEAQLLGRDCYLSDPDGGLVVRVTPTDSPLLSLDSLAAFTGELDFAEVTFSFEPLEAGFQATGCQLGAPELGPDRFSQFIADNPLESILSLQDLARRFDETFGSGSDWRVFCGFLAALPEEISDDFLMRLVVPLLNAGELNWATKDARAVLESRGWSNEQIEQHFSEEEADQRFARHYFFAETGLPFEAIRTANDLFDAICPRLAEEGNFAAVRLICTFLHAHYFTTDTDALERIIFPFLNHFGSAGYSDILDALDDCEHAGSWNAPLFNGPRLPWYGEELA